MNQLLLKIITLLNPVWRNMGADPDQLQVILDAKLKMDGRRRSSFSQMGNRNKKEVKNQDLMTMLMFGFMGIAFMFLLILFHDSGTGLTIYFIGWIVLITLTLITDFTDVLIDVRDNYILLPRPVNDRTITLSRLLHIGFYLSKMVLAYSVGAAVYLTVKFGPGGLLLFIFLMALSVILAVLFVNVTYLVILRFTSPARFKDVITYIQIGFSSSILISYYILPRVIDLTAYETLTILDKWYAWILPPAWLGAVWSLIMTSANNLSLWMMSVLALLAPVVSIYLVANFLAKDFNQKMLQIGMGSSVPSKGKEHQQVSERSSWRERTANWFTRSPEERAGFEWTWSITQRSRTFRLKLYPLFGFVPAYFAFLFLSEDGSLSDKIASLLEGKYHIVLLYFCLFILTGAYNLVAFSERYKAAWVYQVGPVRKPGPIIMGAFKACVTKYFLPFYLFISLLIILGWGPKALLDIGLAFSNVILIALLMSLVTQKTLPFSQAWENQNKGTNFAQGMLTLIAAGAIASAHYFLVGLLWWIGPLFLLGSLTFLWMAYRSYAGLEWSDLKS